MLAPDLKLTKQTLSDNLNTVHSITVGELAVRDLAFPYPGGSPPDWYGPVKNRLAETQQHATEWVDTLGPKLFATVPQDLIDLGNFVVNAVPKLSDLKGQLSGQADDKNALDTTRQIVQQIIDQSDQLSCTLDKLNEQLTQFIQQFLSDRQSLVTAVKDAEKQMKADTETLRQLESQLTQLQVKLARDSDQASQGEIGSATATFGVVVSLVSIAATGGFGSIISFAVGIVKVGTSVVKAIEGNEEVQQDIKAIYDLMEKASDETFQIAMMRTLINSLDDVLYRNLKLQNSVPELIALLQTVCLEAENVKTALAQPQFDVNKIPGLSGLDDSRETWKEIIKFATAAENNTLNRKPLKITQQNQGGSSS